MSDTSNAAGCKELPRVDEVLLARARRYIEENYTKSPSLEAIARAAGYSPFHFHRIFSRHFGETPKQMMTRLKVELSKALLRSGEPAPQVAAKAGFANQSHFTTRFKQVVGLTPGRWLRLELIAGTVEGAGQGGAASSEAAAAASSRSSSRTRRAA